jgi:type III secretion system FlhB-like substrate exporter
LHRFIKELVVKENPHATAQDIANAVRLRTTRYLFADLVAFSAGYFEQQQDVIFHCPPVSSLPGLNYSDAQLDAIPVLGVTANFWLDEGGVDAHSIWIVLHPDGGFYYEDARHNGKHERLTATIAWAVYRSLDGVVHMADGTLDQAFEMALRLATYCYRSTLIALIVFAIIDWMLRRHFFMKQMMMDEEEVERENKEQYGEKHVRSHRKRMMHEMVMGGERRRRPPNAVVTNPTHFAIGLRYVPSECPLPIVVARTKDEEALQMISDAKEAGIPIVRSIWLARTLYAVGKEDQVIPRITLKAVAAVYRAIIEVTMKEGAVSGVLHVDERY